PAPAPFPYTTLFRSQAGTGVQPMPLRNPRGDSGGRAASRGERRAGRCVPRLRKIYLTMEKLMTVAAPRVGISRRAFLKGSGCLRSEEHTSELQSREN